jgi:hypothetical protein
VARRRDGHDICVDQLTGGLLLRRAFGRNDAAACWTAGQWGSLFADATPLERRCLYLCLAVGLSRGSAAAEIGCSKSNVYQALARFAERNRDAILALQAE